MGMEREGIGGFELLVIVVAGIALALVGAVWVGAWLALAVSGGGHLPFAAAVDAAPRLPAHMSHLRKPGPSPTPRRYRVRLSTGSAPPRRP